MRSSSPRSRPSATRKASGLSNSNTHTARSLSFSVGRERNRPPSHQKTNAPLRPPDPEQLRHLPRRLRLRAPRLLLRCVELERLLGQVGRDLLERRGRCRGVRRQRRAGEQHREEARHRSVVSEEDAFAAADELEPEGVAERPRLRVVHDLHLVHRLERGEVARPAAQVGRSAPQASDRLDPVPLERRLRTERPRVGIDVVAAGGRLDRMPGRAGEAERPDQTLVDEVGERRVGEPGDALAEQRICEVRVVPPFPGRQDELGIGQAGDELVAFRELERFPDLAGRLTLDS